MIDRYSRKLCMSTYKQLPHTNYNMSWHE